MLLVALALACAAQEVLGLKAGEQTRAETLAASHSLFDVRGRVLDGTNGLPFAGADVELWSEGDGPAPRRFAQTQTLSDGSFLLPRADNAHADKIIVRAQGHRSTLTVASDTDEIVLLPAAKHLGLRAVDLDGKPIAGAKLETRQTCAHAPPAFVAVSDASGTFDLSAFPPLDEGPESVISARGYGAVLLESADPLLAAGGLEVRLPKRRPLAFQLVDANAKPLADFRVALGEEPRWLALATDSEGRVVCESPFAGREFALNALDADAARSPGVHALLADGRAPIALETKVRVVPGDADALPRAEDASPLRVVDGGGRTVDLPVRVLRERGSSARELEGVRALAKDAGKVTLVAGGAFTGWSECVRTLAAPEATELRVEREPLLEVRLPPDRYWLVHVQAGDDSITLENPTLPLRQFVPAGKAITVCAVRLRETRCAQLGHIEDDRVLDLTRESSVVPPRMPEDASVVHVLRAPGLQLSGHVRLAHAFVELAGASDVAQFEVPANASFEGCVGAEGRVALAIGPWNGLDCKLELPRRARLVVRGKLKSVFAGGQMAAVQPDGGFAIDGLAPGPLLAELVLADESETHVLRANLVLADGEERELTVR